jgi:hypothetical protein
MAEAFTIQYTGSQTTATLYKEAGVLYLTIGASTTTYALANPSHDTLTELVATLDAVTDVTCTLTAAGTTASTLLNDISGSYKADIKTLPYVVGHSNYTSPKRISQLVRRNADKIQQNWLDEADAALENLTGYVFRSTTLSSTNLNISGEDIFTNDEYAYCYSPHYNALILRDYYPVSTLTTLTVNDVSVTPSYVIVDHNTLTLSSDAETGTFVPGRAKVALACTYGYSGTSREGILATEYATLYIIQQYFIKELMDAKLSGAKIDHASVVISDTGANSEAITRAEISSRMKEIEKSLPSKLRYKVG